MKYDSCTSQINWNNNTVVHFVKSTDICCISICDGINQTDANGIRKKKENNIMPHTEILICAIFFYFHI